VATGSEVQTTLNVSPGNEPCSPANNRAKINFSREYSGWWAGLALKSWRSDYSRRIFLATMVSELATEYREMAEQCLTLTAAARHFEAKTGWLDLAQKWLLLAQLADKYAAEQSGRKRGRNIRNALLN